MHLIAYSSSYTGDSSQIDQDLFDICQSSKALNPQKRITGLLFYHQGTFLQIIEGPQEHLEDLMTVLERDPRHKDIIRQVDCPIENRSYSDWNMDSFNLSSEIPIQAHTLTEISRAFIDMVEPRTDLLTRFYRAMLASAV